MMEFVSSGAAASEAMNTRTKEKFKKGGNSQNVVVQVMSVKLNILPNGSAIIMHKYTPPIKIAHITFYILS